MAYLEVLPAALFSGLQVNRLGQHLQLTARQHVAQWCVCAPNAAATRISADEAARYMLTRSKKMISTALRKARNGLWTMKGGVKLYSHPRSGTNYCATLLEEVFYGRRSVAVQPTGHWSDRYECEMPSPALWGAHPFFRNDLPKPRIYLYRDGRDLALSMWRSKEFQHPDWRSLTFSEFIRKPLDWYVTPGHRASPQMNIVEHWLRHLDSWRNAPETYFLSYEALLTDPEKELSQIGRWLDRPVDVAGVYVGPVGPAPGHDHRVSKWKATFSDEDLEFFFTIVPDDHWGLWS
jgi:bile-salt sulfotransferase